MSKATPTPAPASPWMNRRAAADWFGISVDTFDDWRRDNPDLPEHRAGNGRPLFHRDELDAWIRSRCTTTPKKAPKKAPPKARRTDPDDDLTAELVG